MSAYYNEHDPYAAQWIRNLIAGGHIAPGIVDERSIADVRPADIAGFAQCHFFAGIGVWSHALRLAGVNDSRPVWTGSCPCQPFSAAGRGGGFDDERHLWPHFLRLIAERRPAVVFGEQVASKAAEPWVDLVCADVEALGYAFAAVPFPAAGVGAPHIRDRLYWVADGDNARLEGRGAVQQRAVERTAGPGGVAGRLGNTECVSPGRDTGAGASEEGRPAVRAVGDDARPSSAACGLADSESGGRREERADDGGLAARDSSQGLAAGSVDGCGDCWLADDDGNGLQSFAGLRLPGSAFHDADGRRPVRGAWADAEWIPCRDGKWRPVEPGTFPLAHGAASRVGRLRAYGNAICAQAASGFIGAYLDLG